MKNYSNSPFRDSDMHRAKTKKHVFRSLINRNLKQQKRYDTDTGLVEDRHNSTTIVRVVVGLLLIHLIVIGGVILRGKIKSGEGTAIAAPTITAPPTAAADTRPANNDVLPQPVDGPVANPVRTPDTPHITQPAEPVANTTPAVNEPEIVTPVVADTPPAPAADPAPAEPTTPAADTAFTRHLVSSGETLYGIAAKHQTTVEAIRKANPQLRNNNIISGTYLNIPVKPDSAAGREIAARKAEEAASEAAKTYTIKRGDTLAKIARKHKTTVPRLMELNNIPKGKEGSIRVGDTLRISQ
ncbi:MAG: LysM peptidoglycan-binding domain-containing protein [Akkermansia sp.]|nr:LysM peptidoglycan-binding domain-containing protein [Akkermansia sp.]